MEISLVFGLFYCFIYFFIKAYKEILDPYAAFFLAPGLYLQISFNKRSKWTNRKTFIVNNLARTSSQNSLFFFSFCLFKIHIETILKLNKKLKTCESWAFENLLILWRYL